MKGRRVTYPPNIPVFPLLAAHPRESERNRRNGAAAPGLSRLLE
jgi:hypothetical protein